MYDLFITILSLFAVVGLYIIPFIVSVAVLAYIVSKIKSD